MDATNKPNTEQMNFIYEHYPEYGSERDYTPIFTWFKQQAEQTEAAHLQSDNAYLKDRDSGDED